MAGSSKSGPDLELKKAFMEMQSKMIEGRQKMKFSDLQIENCKRSMTHSDLTRKEIGSLPEETRIYQSLGRMFILSSQSEVKEELTKKQKLAQEKIKTLESNKDYLQKSLKENENSLRELVSQKRGV